MENPYAAPIVAGANPNPVMDPSSQITEEVADALRRTKPWVLFIAILGFLGAAFMALAGVGMLVMGMSDAMGPVAKEMPYPSWALSLVYLVFVPFYVWPSIKLLSYSKRIGAFLEDGRSVSLAQALDAQRSFWKLMGIFVIVSVALYGLLIAGATVYGLNQALQY